MTWVRVDDNFPDCADMAKIQQEHPRMYGNCMALWLAALCYSSRNLTDGFLFESRLCYLLPSKKAAKGCTKVLLEVGLWERKGNGIVIKNYLTYNPSKDEILAKKKVNTEKLAKWRAKKKKECVTGLQDGVCNRVVTGPYIPSHPLKRLKEGERYESQDCKDTADTTQHFTDNPKPSLVWKIWEEEAGRPCGDMSYHLEHLRVILSTCEKSSGDTAKLIRKAVKGIWDNFRTRGKTPNPRFLAADISRYLSTSGSDSVDSDPQDARQRARMRETDEFEKKHESDKKKWEEEQLEMSSKKEETYEEHVKRIKEKYGNG